jgi:hypothetical protein
MADCLPLGSGNLQAFTTSDEKAFEAGMSDKPVSGTDSIRLSQSTVPEFWERSEYEESPCYTDQPKSQGVYPHFNIYELSQLPAPHPCRPFSIRSNRRFAVKRNN